VAKPDEKRTKTAILKRIYGVLELEHIHRPMGVKLSVSDLAKRNGYSTDKTYIPPA